jgi:MoaA/NifB/PqqE/SkfB family radical SAM enzyme
MIKADLKPIPEIKGLDFTKKEKQAALKNNRMLLLNLLTEMACNYDCPYCFTRNTTDKTRKPLSIKDYKNVFKEAKDLGTRSVWWIGAGEPLLYPKIWELLDLINDYELTPLLFTNGSLLTKNNCKQLMNKNVSLYVKYNSFDDKTQDFLVGNIKGASTSIKTGINNLIDIGYNKYNPSRLAIQSVITQRNIKYLPDLYRWARKNEIIPFFEIIVYTGFPVNEVTKALDIDARQMKAIFEKLLEVDQKEFGYTWMPTPPYVGRQCDKYYYSLTLNPYGDIMSCAAAMHKIGNVKEKALDIMWNDPFIKKLKNVKEKVKGKCKACKLDCSGCRAEVYAKTGNIYDEYERCWK